MTIIEHQCSMPGIPGNTVISLKILNFFDYFMFFDDEMQNLILSQGCIIQKSKFMIVYFSQSGKSHDLARGK